MKKHFKLSVIFSLVLLSVLGSCRKKTPAEYEKTSKPFHCYNGTLDGDEILIDQGGSCADASAAPLTSSCGLASGTIVIGTQTKAVTSCIKTINANGDFVFTMNYSGGGYISVTTTNDVLYNSDLSLTTSSNPGSNYEAYVFLYPQYNYMSGGNVQIQFNGSSYAVSSCNGYNWGTSESVKIFAHVN
jgi:hypothetical protein